jgi:hypothetical protein
MNARWLRPYNRGSQQECREQAARRAARLMNNYDVPGIPPLTLGQKLQMLTLALLIALTLCGLGGLLLVPAPHP